MDAKLLEILVCPLCKSPLVYNKAERLAFKIQDDIPVMLADEARVMTPEEVEKIR